MEGRYRVWNRVRRSAGLWTGLGVVLIVLFGAAAISYLTEEPVRVGETIIGVLLTAFGVFAVVRGVLLRRTLAVLRDYCLRIGGARENSIDQLALSMGKPRQAVAKELETLIRRGYLGGVYLDWQTGLLVQDTAEPPFPDVPPPPYRSSGGPHWLLVAALLLLFPPIGLFLLFWRLCTRTGDGRSAWTDLIVPGLSAVLAGIFFGCYITFDRSGGLTDEGAAALWLSLLLLLSGSIAIIKAAAVLRLRRRVQRYSMAIAGRRSVDLDELSETLSLSYGRVERELAALIAKGYFPGADLQSALGRLVLP